MKKSASSSGGGTADVGQEAVEKRALEIAKADGREEINKDDVSQAREEILGPSASTEATDKGPLESATPDSKNPSSTPHPEVDPETRRDNRVAESEGDSGRTR